jgi:hypothetical protein
LGTPHRSDYKLDWTDISKGGNVYNVYDKNDNLVQGFLGGIDSKLIRPKKHLKC